MFDTVKFTSLLKKMTGKKVQYNEGKLQYLINDGQASVMEGAEYVHIRVAEDVGNRPGWTIERDRFTNAVVSERHSPLSDTKTVMDDLKIMSRAIQRQ